MLQFSFRPFPAVALLAGLALLVGPTPGRGQGKDDKKDPGTPVVEPDIIRVKTPDGLSLWGKWFSGGRGQKSDAVILVHGYRSNASDGKSPWEPLAKSLQRAGYSVLMFDLRGHGRSTDFKVFGDKEQFCKYTFNKYAGHGLNPKGLKELKVERFSASYYPYLINDVAGARRFVDEKNDLNECNAGRVFVIAEKDISPLVMLWLTTEWKRNGVGPATRFDVAKQYVAGKDIAGAVFLSWSTSSGGATATASALADRVMNKKVLFSDNERVGDMMREKVAMAFVYGKEDARSAAEARRWFREFRVPDSQKDDKEKVKYMVEVPGAEKLTGIKLCEITENRKDKDGAVVKASMVEGQIMNFLKATKDKGINGTSNGPKRYVDNYDPIPVPLHDPDIASLPMPK